MRKRNKKKSSGKKYMEDPYTIRARKEGYPARSVYKLMEIQEKFGIIKPGYRVLDIGASPGSWAMYTLKVLKGKGSVTTVDKEPLISSQTNGIETFNFIQGDILEKSTEQKISGRAPFDLILSDAAPETTGNRTVDTARSFGLAEKVICLAEEQLRAGGNLVVKIFQGGDEGEILNRLRRLFERVRAYHPKASRSDSFEIFFIGFGKKT
ncbi:MAG: 50S rRNA methyltransferase [Spirochaetes bacterium]|nr:MAG: 50S rRNA methyltransferase [Spirochaetota bacterium]